MNNTLDNNQETNEEINQEINKETVEKISTDSINIENKNDVEIAKTLDEVVKDELVIVDKKTGHKRKIRRFHLGSNFELRIKHHKYIYLAASIIFAISLGSLVFESIRFNKDMKVWPEAFLLLISGLSVILSFLTVFVWRIVIRIKHKEIFDGLILDGNNVTIWDGISQIEKGYLFKARFTWYLGIRISIQAFGYDENDILVKYLEIDIPNSKLDVWYRYYEKENANPQKEFLSIDIDKRKVEFYKKIYNNNTKE